MAWRKAASARLELAFGRGEARLEADDPGGEVEAAVGGVQAELVQLFESGLQVAHVDESADEPRVPVDGADLGLLAGPDEVIDQRGEDVDHLSGLVPGPGQGGPCHQGRRVGVARTEFSRRTFGL